MRRILTTSVLSGALLGLLLAATPNGGVLTYNGDANTWVPSSLSILNNPYFPETYATPSEVASRAQWQVEGLKDNSAGLDDGYWNNVFSIGYPSSNVAQQQLSVTNGGNLYIRTSKAGDAGWGEWRTPRIDPVQVRASRDAGYAWEDLRVPLATLSKASSAPDWVEMMDSTGSGGSGGVYVYSFSAISEQDLLMQAQMPHAWAPGTEVEAHLHWQMLTNNVGVTDGGSLVAIWQLECALAGIGESFSVSGTPTLRSHSGTSATLRVSAHKFEVGQNIVVSGVTETGGCSAGAYNGNYRVASLTADSITYTSSVSCSEDESAASGAVAGYTIVRTANATNAAASLYTHKIVTFGVYRMANCGTVSCIWNCRLSRPTSALDLQEGVGATELDWHYMRGAEGSTTMTSY